MIQNYGIITPILMSIIAIVIIVFKTRTNPYLRSNGSGFDSGHGFGNGFASGHGSRFGCGEGFSTDYNFNTNPYTSYGSKQGTGFGCGKIGD